jgi:hypothetical protein
LVENSNHYLEKVLFSSNISWIDKEKKLKEYRQLLTKEYCEKNPQLEEEYVKGLIEKF